MNILRMNNLGKEIEQAGIILHNVNQPRIKTLLANYGYSAARFQEGQSLLNQLQLLQLVKMDEYHAKGQLGRSLRADEQDMHDLFVEHRALAKWIFRANTDEYQRLGLHQPVASRIATKMMQIQHFYHEVLKSAKVFSQHGLPRPVLEQAQEMVTAIVEARSERVQKTGEAQLATQKRDEVRRALGTWVADFRAIARIALRDEPQLLESLGVVVS